jgi:hypothetical protein
VDGVDDANSVGVGDAVMTLNKDGNVGVGMDNPSVKLHLKTNWADNDYDGLFIRDNQGTDYVQLGSNSDDATVGSAGFLRLKNVNDNPNDGVLLQGNGISHINGGNVGINELTPKARLHVRGIGGYGLTTAQRAWFAYSHTTLQGTGGWANDISVYGTNDLVAGSHIVAHAGSFTSSDRRIKKDIVDVDDATALETLRLLKPKRYKYINVIGRSEDPVYGFIAQEVRETLPYATRLQTEFIPNIYELSNVSQSNVITFTNFTTTNLLSHTSKIKLKDRKGEDNEVTIMEVIDDHSIRVEEDLTDMTGAFDEETEEVVSGNQIFVYGEEVDDFVFLKKEAIFTIATAALQEVDRQQQADKARIVELETQLQSEKSKIATMELLVASLVTRVGDLERSLI